jgi:hypothetical protein
MGTLWAMWGFQALLAAVVISALLWTYFRVAASHESTGGRCQYRFDWPRTWYGGRLAAGVVLSLAAALVLLGADRLMFATDSGGAGQPESSVSISDRKTLDEAIADWVSGLKADWEQQSEQGDSPAEIPVYFVSAQGGGIRSAYWTALVLDRLADLDPAFEHRTFSISGVSGGSVGAAVWSVCEPDAQGGGRDRTDCIKGLGQANLLTPLMSAWLFEDVLARFLPSAWCRLPGCGIMSRGNWFERSLEQDVARLAAPMNGPAAGANGPSLFLNSTWVENGERAIASRLRVEPANFPAAGDQLARINRDLPLSTAAHNSARFTYINAIGNADGKGHLADGGYFDNSGGHTTDDILRAFRRWLFDADDGGKLDQRQDDLQDDLKAWAQRHLVPQAIQIRNGIDAPGATETSDSPGSCPADFNKPTKGLSFYSDLLGPAFAAFNAIGTGSNGRVAEANVCKSVEAWRSLRRAAHPDMPAPSTLTPLRRIDLNNQNVLYPLGWYLSPTARAGMEQAASQLGPLSQ